MAKYWRLITTEGGQDSHTVSHAQDRPSYHILDNSIVSKLYKLEESSHQKPHALPKFVSGMGGDRGVVQQQQRTSVVRFSGKTHLFDPTLSMLMNENNVVVIPEAVLRECYANTSVYESCPFRSNGDGEWQWGYRNLSEIEAKQDKLKYFWDDRALLLSHFIHQRFEQDAVAVCASPDDFVERFSEGSKQKKLIIVCDSKTSGDDAIRDIVTAMDSQRFPKVTCLTNDTGLAQSLYSRHESILNVDISRLMSALVKYSGTPHGKSFERWTMREMQDLFKLTYHANRDFHDSSISHEAKERSKEFLALLGISPEKEKGTSR